MAGAGDRFKVGAWTVDPSRLVVEKNGSEFRVRPKVMDVLVALAERPGEVLSKRQLLDTVWSDVTVGDASLTVAVRELRTTLGDDREAPSYIETIRGRGYRLVAPVALSPHGGAAVATAGSQFWLIGEDLEFVLNEGENLVGRAPDADVHIEMPKVSRRHARITVSGDTATVEDLGSKNGTFIGDAPIDGPTPLRHGNELRLGNLAAVLRVVVLETGSTVTELSREKPTTHPPKNEE